MKVDNINQHNVKYTSHVAFSAREKAADNPKSNKNKLLVASLGGLAVAGTALFFILKNKKLPKTSQMVDVAEDVIQQPLHSRISYPAELVSQEISENNRAYSYLKRNVRGFYLEYGREMNTFLRTGKLKEPPKIADDMPDGLKDYARMQAEEIKDTNRAIVDSIEKLDNCFNSKTTKPMVVYRDAPRRWLDTAQDGILIDKGYCSTSLTPGASMEGMIGADAINNIRYQIRLPKGASYLDLTHTSEKEVLLPRDSKFRIIDGSTLELIL